MINHKYKFIFVHIPKTGGVSIERSLGYNGLRHQTYSNDKNKEYFRFTFVRNTYDLLVSWYSFQPGIKQSYHDFKTWVKSGCPSHAKDEVLRKRPQDQHRHDKNYINIDGTTWNIYEHLQQFRWATDIDFIGRYENLQNDFNIICDKIGIPPRQLPHKNKSKHKHYTEYYDDEAREIVAKKYAKDIEYFGYEFAQ